MAVVNHPNYVWQQERSGSWGNAQIATVEYTVPISLDQLDGVRLMHLRPGQRILAVQLTVTEVSSTSVTCNIGVANKPEIDAWAALGNSANTAAQNAALSAARRTYFISGINLNAKSFTDSRSDMSHEILDVKAEQTLFMTLSAADIANTADIVVSVIFEYIGE